MRYVLTCKGGNLICAESDRFLVLGEDGARSSVAAGRLTPGAIIAGRGRILKVAALAEPEDAPAGTEVL